MSNDPNSAKDAKVKVKEAAGAAAENLKAEVQNVAGKVTGEAAQYADQAKGAAADEVKGVASALRTAADEMRSGSPQERTMSQIAEGLADVSDSMRDKDLGEMVGTVSDFARRNPLAFLGGAALIGFAATRFAKASKDGGASRGSDTNSRDGMSAPTYARHDSNVGTNHEGDLS